MHPGGKLGRLLLRVKDIMKVGDEIPIVKKSQEMGEALIEITSKGLGCVGIISEISGDLVGIITDGDLRRHMDKKFLEKKIENVMTKNPKTLSGNELIADALSLMNKESITNFFITEKMKPVGVLHVHNILKF